MMALKTKTRYCTFGLVSSDKVQTYYKYIYPQSSKVHGKQQPSKVWGSSRFSTRRVDGQWLVVMLPLC
jgi:hypothetical protein